MKKTIMGGLVLCAAVGAFALGLTDVPNEGSYPAAKPVINANNRLIEAAVSNVETTVAGVVPGVTNLAFVDLAGKTNTLLLTNGTIRIIPQ